MSPLMDGKTACSELNCKSTYLSALKRAAGVGGRRKFSLTPLRRFLRDHPDWKMTEVYPARPGTAASRRS